MAIYGIGAYYNGEEDVSEDFVSEGLACVGWDFETAPTLHVLLRQIKNGDIVYIKSTPIGQGLRIKAVGIVVNNNLAENDDLGTCVTVRWLWAGNENLGDINDKYNVRNNTLYEELNRDVQSRVIDLLLSRITSQ